MENTKKTLYTHSAAETEYEAGKIAENSSGNETVALFGGLGMGKTAFTRGFARGLGLDESTVSSPTFAIVHEHYDGSGQLRLCHYDMYRVSGWEDLESTGFFDTLERCVNIIEWSENIRSALPVPRWNVTIGRGEGENDRKLTIEYISEPD